MFHDKYQWEIWKNTAGKSARLPSPLDVANKSGIWLRLSKPNIFTTSLVPPSSNHPRLNTLTLPQFNLSSHADLEGSKKQNPFQEVQQHAKCLFAAQNFGKTMRIWCFFVCLVSFRARQVVADWRRKSGGKGRVVMLRCTPRCYDEDTYNAMHCIAMIQFKYDTI